MLLNYRDLQHNIITHIHGLAFENLTNLRDM